jgi:hypothetical protein
MKNIILLILASVVIWIVYEVASVYSVLSKSNYSLPISLNSIGGLTGGSGFEIKITNPTRFKVYLTDVKIEFLKNGVIMGGFQPVDVKLTRGENLLKLKFLDNTKFLIMAGDYALGNTNTYRVRFRGRYMGFIPFSYSMSLSEFI